MTIATSFFIYFLIWWVMLFTVLPLGVRRHQEPGKGFEFAYSLVQEHAMKVWDSDVQFLHLLLEDETVDEYLSKEVLRGIFNYRHCIERTADVIDRVLEEK